MAYHPEKVEVLLTDVGIIERPTTEGGVEKIVSISPDVVARAVANMSYDSFGEFLKYLSANVDADGDKDNNRGRKKLSSRLYSTSMYLDEARESLKMAWEICKNHMKKDEGGYDAK